MNSTATAPYTTSRRNRLQKLAGTRTFWLRLLAVTLLAAVIGAALYHQLYGRWFESTEDAYASGNVVEVTPQLNGTIVEIGAEDNRLVSAGQVLVRFDDADTKVALDQAEASLAQTIRRVRGLYASAETQQAEQSRQEIAVIQAQIDLDRRAGLAETGAISQEELSHAELALKAAQQALASSRGQVKNTRALIDNTKVATHPEVLAAAATLRKAFLDHNRTSLRAPLAGYVTQRNAQVGRRVTAGLPLMSLVPLEQLWVDANFKETQLRHMRVGQPAEIHADIYGEDVTYHGRVASLGIGTGSAMSILPAQNATGNWIKIVQRVPVRITLDAKELRQHPLRLGLSMHVKVDMRDRNGPVLTASSSDKPVYSTGIYGDQLAKAEERIAAIIAANAGGNPPAAKASNGN